MEKYRFDDAYGKVYEYENGAYIYSGSYLGFGISSDMSDEEKTIKCENSERY